MKDGYATSIKRVKQRESPVREGKVLGSPGVRGVERGWPNMGNVKQRLKGDNGGCSALG